MNTTADNQLQVGDRVKVIKTFCGLLMENKRGTIREIRYNDVGVEFDIPFSQGHNLHGKLNNKCGRYGDTAEVIKLPLQYDLFGKKI
jgi:hypothetical protein